MNHEWLHCAARRAASQALCDGLRLAGANGGGQGANGEAGALESLRNQLAGVKSLISRC